MYKILAICGERCSGKDKALSSIVSARKEKVNKKITCTTRPKKDNEMNDYIFMTKKEFVDKMLNDEFIECSVAQSNSEGYGTLFSTLSEDKINVGIYNLEGIDILIDNRNVILQIVYLDTDDKIRFKRLLDRDDDKTIEEIYDRFELDKKEMYSLDLYPNVIRLSNNTEEEFEMVVKNLEYLVDRMEKM